MATNQDKLDGIYARTMGREVQRWATGTDVLKLKEVPEGTPGALAIRSADVLDIIGVLQKLLTLQASVDALNAKLDPAAITAAVKAAVAANPPAAVPAVVDVSAIAEAVFQRLKAQADKA